MPIVAIAEAIAATTPRLLASYEGYQSEDIVYTVQETPTTISAPDRIKWQIVWNPICPDESDLLRAGRGARLRQLGKWRGQSLAGRKPLLL